MNQKPTSPSLSPTDSKPTSDSRPKAVSDPLPADDPPSLDAAMRIDRFRLRRLKKRLSPDVYSQRVAESVGQCEIRKAARPRIEYPSDLPISGYREELVDLIRDRQVIVVCGETGSGKSTQLPKMCLDAGLGRDAMIGHTQPRRLAARSIGSRLAEEVGTPLGKWVGYQVRFGDQTGPETLIKLMTDGILLAETQSDRFLDAYDAIIIDEAHERSLNIDFLLGYLRRLQAKRPDLKIIITSATIDAERFAEHFADQSGPAPIVNVEGRGYPVEIRYLPWDDVIGLSEGVVGNTASASSGPRDARGYDLPRHVLAGIDTINRLGSGDALVFLPTERDIREVSHRVSGHFQRLGLAGRVDLLPLYSRLPQAEQQRIFQPSGNRQRIIFATNVAESSLTVPGIRYVIDAGTARISRYSPRSKLQRLPIEPISRASADQRAGRCGRVGPGVCVRLYAVDDYESRDDYTTPEIRRTNLASVVLQTKTLGLGKLEEFPLLDPPRPETIREGVRTLIELGAVDDRHELTEIGWKLGRMPVDPRVGRIILAAEENGTLAEILPIAAALEIPDPRDRPPERRQAADQAHAEFADPRSDFLSYLRLWRYYDHARGQHSRSKLTRELRKRFLSPTRMREWADVYRQLRDMAQSLAAQSRAAQSRGVQSRGGNKRSKVTIGRIRFIDDDQKLVDDDRYAAIHQSLLTGLLSGVAMAGDKNQYTGAGGLTLFLWPGSGVFAAKPKWIVAAELVETAKQYARTVAQIQPRWIEQVGAHLLKASHSDPHWSRKAGGAFCYQRLSLFGLPVVVQRRVPLAPIDPVTARDLLIESGLVGDELRTSAKFVRHNRNLADAITQLAAKTRRRDLVIDSYAVARFYQSRIPAEVCDRSRLEKFDRELTTPDWSTDLRDAAALSQWLAASPEPAAQADATTAYMRPEDVLDVVSESITTDDYPDELAVGSSRLPLQYRFEPGSQRDGINLRIHKAALNQISDAALGWLVPGLLHTKLVGMIKSLPKRIRRNLVPAAEVASKIIDELQPAYGVKPFMQAACEALSRHAEMPVTAGDFQSDKLDDHLQFLITVVDDEGSTIAEGRQVDPLKRDVGAVDSEQVPMTSDSDHALWARESMTTFDIDELPREVIGRRGGVEIAQYPGLVDSGDAVATRLFADATSAEASLRIGAMRLFSIAERKELRSQVRWLPSLEEAKIKLGGAVASQKLESSLVDLLARIAFVESAPVIRTRDDFQSRRDERGRRIAEAAQQVAIWLTAFADSYFAARRETESLSSGRFATATTDIHRQIEWLLADGFLSITPWNWLKHYPRYFAAIAYRIDKLRSGSAARDDQNIQAVRSLWDRWIESLSEAQREPTKQAANEFRWMTEELRVSLFAQPLGTAVKVSPTRCEKLLR
jgi:ATP-dependent helicase HrpA